MHDHDNHLKCPFCKNDVNIKKALLNEYSPEVRMAYKERFKGKEEEQTQKAIELAKWEESLKSKDNNKKQEVIENDKRIEMLAEEKANVKILEITKEAEEKAEAIYTPELTKASNTEIENIELRQKVIAFEQSQKSSDQKTDQKVAEALAIQQEKNNQENEFIAIERKEELEKVTKNLEKGLTQINQGSNQVKGDIGEISVSSHLNALYPLDDITRTAKGANGADILQIVSSDGVNNCGKIYLEIKRTQSYEKSWLPKLKSDGREKKANVLMLISQTLPPEMTHPKCIDGIWICSFYNYEHLLQLHRDYIISNHKSSQAQVNSISGSMLTYNYVNSDDFTRVVENFYANLNKEEELVKKEQRCMNSSWSERLTTSAILGKDMDNIIGTLRGYSTTSSTEVKSLEMMEIGINE